MRIGKGLIALALLVGAGPSGAVESIDLTRAINHALGQNRELVRSALTTDSREFGVAGAETEFRIRLVPEVTADLAEGNGSVGYGLLAAKKLMRGTEVGVSGRLTRDSGSDDALIEGDDLHRGSVRLEIRQPLFRNYGSLIHREGIVQAHSDLRRARRRFEMQKADLVVEVVETYEAILRLEQQVRSDEDSFERMDALHRVTEAKAVLGRTTRIDTLRVDLLRGEALARLEASQERLDSTQRDLAELLGFSPDTVFSLKPPRLLEIDVSETDEAVRTALLNRLDYAQVLADSGDAARRMRIANRQLLPDLNLVAGHEWLGEGPETSDATDLGESVWFAGISVGTDLNRARERVAVSQSRLNHTAAVQTVEIVELSIARQVQQLVLAYRRAQAEMTIADRNLELAADRLRVARRFFELGRVDNFSVTDAEEAFLGAERRSLFNRAEASISAYRLLRGLGTLVEVPAELKP